MKSISDFKSKQDYEAYLRIYFAAMAMQGLLANSEVIPNSARIASDAVLAADQLINHLNLEKE